VVQVRLQVVQVLRPWLKSHTWGQVRGEKPPTAGRISARLSSTRVSRLSLNLPCAFLNLSSF